MDYKYLIQSVFKLMAIIGNHKNMKGIDKKKWVILRIHEELNLKKNDNIDVLLNEIIDYVILVDNKQLKINKETQKYLCFF